MAVINGTTGNDSLNGTAAADTLNGLAGDDALQGLAGADTLNGGDGNDSAYYGSSAAAVNVNLATGVGSGGDAAGDTYSSIENVTGSAFNDTLIGDAGTNLLVGGAGADTLNGGAGIDTVSYANSTVAVGINLAAGTATGGEATGDTLSGFENVTGSDFNDTLVGNTAANLLWGGAGNDNLHGGGGDDTLQGREGTDTLVGDDGNDVLVGGAGADTLNGAAGIDTAYYANSTAGVNVDLRGGVGIGGEAAGDTYSSIENVTGSNFNDTLVALTAVAAVMSGRAGADNIRGGTANDTVFGGADNDALSGQDGNDTLNGDDGNDTIQGGAGADVMNGGAGSDTAYYLASAAGVVVDLRDGTVAGGDAAGDTLTAFENVTGTNFADRLTGEDGANILTGNAGDDVLYAKGGADILIGGDGDDKLVGGEGADALGGGNGNDWAYYHEATAAVVASLAIAASNTGEAAGDTYSSIENLWGTAFNDTLVGNGFANILFGNNGDDTITAGQGDDTVQGGSGNDNLDGQDGNDAVYGDAGTDTLKGGAGDDRLAGGAGADALIGSEGSDWAYYHTSGAAVTVNLATGAASGGDAEGDTFENIENLYGSTSSDSLTGNDGSNRFVGNTGADTLTGGAGLDFFIFREVTDSTVADAGRDTITDFSSTEHDKIDLQPIDADGNAANDDTAFTFTDGGAFTGTGHEVIVQGSAGVYTVLGDIDGDSTADFAITVQSAIALIATDFAL